MTKRGTRGFKEVEYDLSIHTGTHGQAGTDGRVLVNIIGSTGDTGFRKIGKDRTFGKKFGKGQIDSFKIRAIDIGKIECIAIEFEGKHQSSKNQFDSQWQVSMMTVGLERNFQRLSYIFYANQWIGDRRMRKTVRIYIVSRNFYFDQNCDFWPEFFCIETPLFEPLQKSKFCSKHTVRPLPIFDHFPIFDLFCTSTHRLYFDLLANIYFDQNLYL